MLSVIASVQRVRYLSIKLAYQSRMGR